MNTRDARISFDRLQEALDKLKATVLVDRTCFDATSPMVIRVKPRADSKDFLLEGALDQVAVPIGESISFSMFGSDQLLEHIDLILTKVSVNFVLHDSILSDLESCDDPDALKAVVPRGSLTVLLQLTASDDGQETAIEEHVTLQELLGDGAVSEVWDSVFTEVPK